MYNEYYDEKPEQYKQNINNKTSNATMTKVFAWMAYAILITFLVAFGLPYAVVALGGDVGVYSTILIISLIALVVMTFLTRRLIMNARSTAGAVTAFTIYSALMGVLVSSVILYTDLTVIALALGVTAGIFAIMAVYGYFTKKDLVGFGNFLIMFLLGALIISIINIFIGSSLLGFIISYVILGIYIGFIAYDVQNVKKLANSGELTTNISLMMALNLYIDFIYIFIRLVEIIAASRKD